MQERGDPLGQRIAAARGTRTQQVELGERNDFDLSVEGEELTTNDALFRLEIDEENGVIRRLVARSPSLGDADVVAAVLHMRRARFLEHLVLDVARDGLRPNELSEWLEQVEAWPLPRWLQTISLGVLHGAAPRGWTNATLPTGLLARCPRLQPSAPVHWAGEATLEVEEGQLRGLAPGERLRVSPDLLIEQPDSEIHVHAGPPKAPSRRYYAFELHGSRWFLLASNQSSGGLAIFIGGRFVRRTPLLPDDRIVVAPGLVLRFRAT